MHVPRIGRIVSFACMVVLVSGCAGSDPSPRVATPEAEPAAPGAVELASLHVDPFGKRIQKGAIAVEVEEVAEAERAVGEIARDLGGYVQERHASGQGEGRRASLVLRVPGERFEDALAAASTLGQVQDLSTETQDVSEAYLDLETRLRVKRGVEARLRGILDVRAGKLSEILEVETQLARVVEEVERIEGALREYDRRIAWSTLALALSQRPAMVQAGFRANLSASFRRGIATFTAVLGGLAYTVTFLAPWLAAAGVALWVALRIRRRAAARA